MGKKRMQVRQVRRQVRQVRPKVPAAPTTPTQQKRQREQYVAAGGFLQGYAPEFVMRIGYASAGLALLCLLVMLLFLTVLPYGLPVKIVAALAWILPIIFLLSFVLPGVRLAWTDRKKEPRLVQGQLLGASSVSTSLGLGMIMVKTRGGASDQYLCAPEKLAKVPGNVVNVVLTVTPSLRHVRSVSVMGQRLAPRPEQPVPPVLKQLRLLPLLTPVVMAVAVIVGDDATALAPITRNDFLHAVLAMVIAAVLGGAVYLVSVLVQRRLMSEVQALLPGGLT
jgi:hypothetical protein